MDENEWVRFHDIVESMNLRNNVDRDDLALIQVTLARLETEQDWARVMQMRELLSRFIVSETLGNDEVLQKVTQLAIEAGEKLDRPNKCGQYSHDYGQYLHRAGKHKEAIEAFEKSRTFFISAGTDYVFQAIESYYMTSLCYRALGKFEVATSIILQVIEAIQPENPWIAHPLQVLAWLQQDEGKLKVAEQTLTHVIALHEAHEGTNAYILIQVNADIGEIQGILGNQQEAEASFKRSLAIANQ